PLSARLLSRPPPRAFFISCHRASCALSFPPFLFFTTSAPSLFYTLSLHDALPISDSPCTWCPYSWASRDAYTTLCVAPFHLSTTDRKSTRLNSSHVSISYAVFCLKKKKRYTCLNTLS